MGELTDKYKNTQKKRKEQEQRKNPKALTPARKSLIVQIKQKVGSIHFRSGLLKF